MTTWIMKMIISRLIHIHVRMSVLNFGCDPVANLIDRSHIVYELCFAMGTLNILFDKVLEVSPSFHLV